MDETPKKTDSENSNLAAQSQREKGQQVLSWISSHRRRTLFLILIPVTLSVFCVGAVAFSDVFPWGGFLFLMLEGIALIILWRVWGYGETATRGGPAYWRPMSSLGASRAQQFAEEDLEEEE